MVSFAICFVEKWLLGEVPWNYRIFLSQGTLPDRPTNTHLIVLIVGEGEPKLTIIVRSTTKEGQPIL
jgi:hypothetical protein